MYKIISPDAWDYDYERITQLPITKVGSLRGRDRNVLLSRSDESLLHKLGSVKFDDGEVPVHLIALGNTELMGPNRNGDGYRASVCREYHPTFVKHAKFYRNHKASDPSRSYGVVKLSHYNERMGRIELVVGLNSTKQAAARNNGLIADTELQLLGENKPVPVSIGCRVTHDTCSGCGHKSLSPKEYCDAPMCKAGGLKHHMGEVVRLNNDLHHLHADNPDPCFMDISYVPKQADRIAYVLGVLNKTASAGEYCVSGAELAQLVYEDPADNCWKQAARALADTERYLQYPAGMLNGLPYGVSDIVKNHPTTDKLAHLTSALAQHDIVLPIDAFLQLITDQPIRVPSLFKQACVGLFDRLVIPAVNPFEHTGPVPVQYRTWAAKLANDYSLAPNAIARRASNRYLITEHQVTPGFTKSAAVNPLVEEVAQQYGLYVLAAFNQISKQFPLTATACILQNQI